MEDSTGKRFQSGSDGTENIVRARNIKELLIQDNPTIYENLKLDQKDNYAILTVKQFGSIEIVKNLLEEDIPKYKAEERVILHGYKLKGKETILKDIK